MFFFLVLMQSLTAGTKFVWIFNTFFPHLCFDYYIVLTIQMIYLPETITFVVSLWKGKQLDLCEWHLEVPEQKHDIFDFIPIYVSEHSH